MHYDTLFLDRDGVINVEIAGSYVLEPGMFRFCEGTLEAMPLLARRFSRIFVATNQRCVGKGLLSEAGLAEIHRLMTDEIIRHGGRIDRIYYCPDTESNSPCRKPNASMALQAQHDFPETNLAKAIMVGNTLSDMQFGRNAGMHTVFIPSTLPETPFPHPLIDARYDNLLHFARSLQ